MHQNGQQAARKYEDKIFLARAKGRARTQDFRALEQFANLDDDGTDLARFGRKYPGFAPFTLLGADQDGVPCTVSPYDKQFLPAILAWRDLLREVWRGETNTWWNLDILLGLNKYALQQPWAGDARWAESWTHGIDAIHAAGLKMAERGNPHILSSRKAGIFEFLGDRFENAVYELWRKRWRARVCPMCESCFIVAKQKAQKFCCAYCSHNGKNAANRKWWKESGPDWRKRYLADKASLDAK